MIAEDESIVIDRKRSLAFYLDRNSIIPGSVLLFLGLHRPLAYVERRCRLKSLRWRAIFRLAKLKKLRLKRFIPEIP